MSPRRVIEAMRPASFVRRSHWYWRLVRDLQTRDWGYRKPRDPTQCSLQCGCRQASQGDKAPSAVSRALPWGPTPQQWLDGAHELEQLADEAERIARARAASDQGTISEGRGYPSTPPE